MKEYRLIELCKCTGACMSASSLNGVGWHVKSFERDGGLPISDTVALHSSNELLSLSTDRRKLLQKMLSDSGGWSGW